MTKTHCFILIIILSGLLPLRSTARPGQPSPGNKQAGSELPRLESQRLRIEFDKSMRSRVIARLNGKEVPLGAFSASESVTGKEHSWNDFALDSQAHKRVSDNFGGGENLTITGLSGELRKTVSVTIYDEFPNLAVFDVSYTNTGKSPIQTLGWSNNAYRIDAQPNPGKVAFWSFQSGSYERRPNWVVPLHTGLTQQNYLGMNASDYGGGTPIVDVWRRDVGVAVGHVEPRPRLVSLPVSMPDSAHAKIAVNYQHASTLDPGESLNTFRTFVAVHQGDYFRTLVDYRRFMMKRQGFQTPAPP